MKSIIYILLTFILLGWYLYEPTKDLYLDFIHKKMLKYIQENYILLSPNNFKMGDIIYNQRCHLNAVQNILENKSKSVHLVVTYNKNDDEMPFIIHFINKDENDKWVDNTWGWCYKFYDYYYIKEVKETEFDTIGNILRDTKKEFLNKFSNKILNEIFNVKYNIF